MNLLNLIRRATDQPDPGSASSPSSHQQLAEAIAKRPAAALSVAKAQADIEAVHDLSTDARKKYQEDVEAATAAAEQVRSWAEAGMCGPGPDAAIQRASAAKAAAASAMFKADGARAALPRLRELQAEAVSRASMVEDEVRAAVTELLYQEVESDLEMLEAARPQQVEAYARLTSLAEIFRPWGAAHHLAGFASARGTQIKQRLKALEIVPLDETQLRNRARAWRERAQEIASKPSS